MPDAARPRTPPAGEASASVRREGRGAIAAWIVGGLVVLLAVTAVLAELGLRSAAQWVAASRIEQQLPAGVRGEVHVRIGGGPLILQYLSGRFDEIELDAPRLRVRGTRVSAHVVVRGLPRDFSDPSREVTARVSLDGEALSALVPVPGERSAFTLGDGTVAFDGERRVLGIPVGYHAKAVLEAAGTRVLVTPRAARITAGPAGADLEGLVTALLGEDPVPVCVARSLPDGVRVSDITVTPERATVRLSARDFSLGAGSLASRGTCD